MTYLQKVRFLREEHFFELNDWCREFIEDLYSDILIAEPTDKEYDEFLTKRQKEKIDEIWKDAGL